MNVVFASNFLNHHQLPFCEAMLEKTGGQFRFVATEPVPGDRLSLGYHNMNDRYPFVICAYESRDAEEKAKALIRDADVVIAGSAPEDYLTERIHQGKILLRYSERLYKQGYIYLFAPRRIKKLKAEHSVNRNKPVYMLCSSSFTAGDFALNGAYRNKCFKWGYFPEVKEHDLDSLFARKRNGQKASLLWAGRLIAWKHPDDAIRVAEKLKQEGFDFELNVIGNGDMQEKLESMVRDKNLGEYVHLIGSLPPEQVRAHMEASSVFLFTSDCQEGWGAVLNESMNSGCAVVASDEAGATGYLVRHHQNGLVYKSGNVHDLYSKVKLLVQDAELAERLGRAAYDSMVQMWNPEVAAERFLALSEALMAGRHTPFADGPCSTAKNHFGGKFYIR